MGPDDALIFSVDLTHNGNTHCQIFFVGKPQGRPRNSKFHDPSNISNSAFTNVNTIPSPFIPTRFILIGNQGIILCTQRIHFKEVGIAPVMVRVQADPNKIIPVYPSPTAKNGGSDKFRVFIMKGESDVKVFTIVNYSHFRFFTGRIPIMRQALDKFSYGLNGLPDGFIQSTIYSDGAISPMGFNSRPV